MGCSDHKHKPGRRCCEDAPCCCCIESITIRFRKGETEVAAIEVPLESVVEEELTVGGLPGKRCTYTTSYAVTCASGGNRLPGYVGIVPLMERTFNRDACDVGSTVVFARSYVGEQHWQASYVVKSIQVQITCNASYKRIDIAIDGVYELIGFAKNGTSTLYNFSTCTVHSTSDLPDFEVETFACQFYVSGRVCPDPLTYADMDNPINTQYFRYDQDKNFGAILESGGSCSSLLEALEALDIDQVWLSEYAPSISTLERCSMPLDISDSGTGRTSCNVDCNAPVYTWRDDADREYELVRIVPDIVLC